MKKKGLCFLLGIPVLAISLSFFYKSQDNNEQKKINYLLTGDSVKYWDPYYLFDTLISGCGWGFYNNGKFIEYTYKDNKRTLLDYGDIIWGDFHYEIIGDTIFIRDYNNYKFHIKYISEDTLIVQDISKIRYTYLDSILLVKSLLEIHM